MGDFYESMSFLEFELCTERKVESCCAKISPGLKDSVAKQHSRFQIAWNTSNAINELRGVLEICSLEHSHQQFHDLCNRSSVEGMASVTDSLHESCSIALLYRDATTSDVEVKYVNCTDSKHSTNCVNEVCKSASSLHSTLDVEPCLQVTTHSENSTRYFILYLCDNKSFDEWLG